MSLTPSTGLADGMREPGEITGVTWQWQQTLYNNDHKSVPADPSHYTVTFNPDGALNIRADCNRGGGKYTAEGKRLSMEVTHTTRAMCPPDSLDQAFIKDLNAAAGYFFIEGHLYLDLKYDTGTMKFAR
jgi:heat shock protein HslJ